jgi:hypothetical protein
MGSLNEKFRIPKAKLNTPWSHLFSHGVYMPLSYKRILRRWFANSDGRFEPLFDIKKDKVNFISFAIKYFIFDSQKLESADSGTITQATFSFNRTFKSRLAQILLALRSHQLPNLHVAGKAKSIVSYYRNKKQFLNYKLKSLKSFSRYKNTVV